MRADTGLPIPEYTELTLTKQEKQVKFMQDSLIMPNPRGVLFPCFDEFGDDSGLVRKQPILPSVPNMRDGPAGGRSVSMMGSYPTQVASPNRLVGQLPWQPRTRLD